VGRWQLIIVSVYVHCKTHRKISDIEMNETLNLHRQQTKWTADIELDKNMNRWKYFRSSNHKIAFLTPKKVTPKIRTFLL